MSAQTAAASATAARLCRVVAKQWDRTSSCRLLLLLLLLKLRVFNAWSFSADDTVVLNRHALPLLASSPPLRSSASLSVDANNASS